MRANWSAEGGTRDSMYSLVLGTVVVKETALSEDDVDMVTRV